VRALCAFLEERYDGDAARIWREAESGKDLKARLAELPGFDVERSPCQPDGLRAGYQRVGHRSNAA